MKINLQNKISLVTGAGRGIGEAICLDLAKAGSKIIAISRNDRNLKILKKKIHGNGHFFFFFFF